MTPEQERRARIVAHPGITQPHDGAWMAEGRGLLTALLAEVDRLRSASVRLTRDEARALLGTALDTVAEGARAADALRSQRDEAVARAERAEAREAVLRGTVEALREAVHTLPGYRS